MALECCVAHVLFLLLHLSGAARGGGALSFFLRIARLQRALLAGATPRFLAIFLTPQSSHVPRNLIGSRLRQA